MTAVDLGNTGSHVVRKLTYRASTVRSDSGNHESSANYTVIVGIDFGTTFSGCSYKTVDSEEIFEITRWPKHTSYYAKVPSLLYYRKNTGRLVDWGDGARRLSLQPGQNGILVRQFKMWLTDDADGQTLPPLPPNKSAIEETGVYLRHFHEHAVNEILNRLGDQVTQDNFRYCLTVPAIWSDGAKAAMREAVVSAGIIQAEDPPERLTLVTEPEAAAVYCERQCNSWELGHGDKFMLVDAGGGTVDLIVYQIDDQPGSERSLNEITNGQGGACGSGYIDNNMRNLLKKKLWPHADDIPLCTMESAMEYFVDKIKPSFCGDTDQFLEVPVLMRQYLPEDALNEEGHLRLSVEELREEVFEPVFKHIIELVHAQLESCGTEIDAIFLVGGFGCSEYLYQVLIESFKSRVSTIVMAPRGDIAVARGAVYFASDPTLVTSKVLRRTYGLQTSKLFDKDYDPEESAIITADGVKRCSTRFDVIARKGQRIHTNTKISKVFWVGYPKHTQADLYAFDGDGPIPRHITDPLVAKVADFPIKMPRLDGLHVGDPVDVKIDFAFGAAELQVSATIGNQRIQFITKFEQE